MLFFAIIGYCLSYRALLRGGADNSSRLNLSLVSNCKFDPSPLDRRFTSEQQCISEQSIPYTPGSNGQFLSAYLPTWLLGALTLSERDELVARGFVREAIDALNTAPFGGEQDMVWNVHTSLFYNILYRVPNLTPKERIEAAGEVRKQIERRFPEQLRTAYVTGRWYEEAGVLGDENYDKAVKKYQEALLGKPRGENDYLDRADALERLGHISVLRYRYADAICYVSESINLSASNERKLLLADAVDNLGVDLSQVQEADANPLQESDANPLQEADANPRVLRNTVRENTDASSIEEYFNLAEISLANQDFDEVLGYVQKILTSSIASPSEEAAGYFLEGRIRREQGNLKGALESFTRFIEIVEDKGFQAANLRQGYTMRGSVYVSLGNHAAAAAEYDKALQLSTKDQETAELLAKAANALLQRGDYTTAKSLFDSSVEHYNRAEIDDLPLNDRVNYLVHRPSYSGGLSVG